MSEEKSEKGFTVVDKRGAEKEPGAPASAARPEFEEAEVDFATFVMSFASSALIHLGELSAPGEPASARNLPLAKQTIDILGMLVEKTRGNLTADEAQLVEHLLYDLRLKYVDARKKA